MKAVKFGGTSMATADSVLRVKRIIGSDSARRFIVVSAPGAAEGERKVTDMLIDVADAPFESRRALFEPVAERFRKLCAGVGLAGALDGELNELYAAVDCADRDFILSRGEYLCAKLTAKLTGYDFVDAAELIKFKGSSYDDKYTESVCAVGLKAHRAAVIPGFYGSNEEGKIVTFTRGGSDVSGAIVARAINATVYENYTDVNGFMTCDPRYVPYASVIDVISYKELRELSYMGANVLHPESIFPVRCANIPIHILNTFNEDATGTFIVPTEELLSGKYKRPQIMSITAITGKQHFFSLNLEKDMMNNEVGFVRRVLSCFEKYNIAIEHVPSSIDSVTVVFSAVDKSITDKLIADIQREVEPDHISLKTDVSLIAIVGHGMKARPGTAARAIARLSNADINLRMIDQGASEINIILGVSDDDFVRALRALNAEFEVYIKRKP